MAKKAARGARGFSKVFAFGEAQSCLWQAKAKQLSGDRAAAEAGFEECIVVSERLGTPWERGRALVELARLHAAGSSQRKTHAQRAIEVLEPLSANWDLNTARSLLDR